MTDASISQLRGVMEAVLRGPAVAQVFVAVFLLYLVWAVSHHLWIGFWLALVIAFLFQFWFSRSGLAPVTSSADVEALLARDDNPAVKLPEMLARYALAMLPFPRLA